MSLEQNLNNSSEQGSSSYFVEENFHLTKTHSKSVSLFNFPKILQEQEICIENFEIISFIGEGSYGKVALVKDKNTKQLFALKIYEKMHLRRVT